MCALSRLSRAEERGNIADGGHTLHQNWVRESFLCDISTISASIARMPTHHHCVYRPLARWQNGIHVINGCFLFHLTVHSKLKISKESFFINFASEICSFTFQFEPYNGKMKLEHEKKNTRKINAKFSEKQNQKNR